MFKKICTFFVLSLGMTINALMATPEYEIQDIGTMQTRESEAIAINSQGQILGWYNVNGSKEGKHYFVRERNANFHEFNHIEAGYTINWRYLTDDCTVYGTVNENSNALYKWDQKNGITKVGDLPCKTISAINNQGQVLLESIVETENGKTIRRPVIWNKGVLTKLSGLEGNTGIPSDEAYGYAMNNKGEVVGKSIVYISYKNDLYKQTHATKWVNGQAIDLHREVPKCQVSSATAINDLGDVIIDNYLIRADGQRFCHWLYHSVKTTNNKYFLNESNQAYLNNETEMTYLHGNKAFSDYDCIWLNMVRVNGMNDKGEVIAQGMTIYGENHAMLLIPVKNK